MNLKRLLPLVWLLSLAACKDGGNVELDNAGKIPLTAVIDGQSYVLAGGARQRIELESGSHSLKVSGAGLKQERDTSFVLDEGGLINLAGARYIVWRDLFTPHSKAELLRDSLLQLKELRANKQIFMLDYDTLAPRQLFVERNWDYGLDEDFPTQINRLSLNPDKRYQVLSKLLRRDEFAAYYLRNAGGATTDKP